MIYFVLIPLLLNLLHSFTIHLELLASLLGRFLNLNCKRLVRSHTYLMAAERVIFSAQSLRYEIVVSEKGGKIGKGLIA